MRAMWASSQYTVRVQRALLCARGERVTLSVQFTDQFPLVELRPRPREGDNQGGVFRNYIYKFGESGLLENEPTVPAEQAHTTLRQ